MGAHQDPVQGAVVLGVAVICAGLYGAFDALVGMMIHLSSSFLFDARVVWADFGFPYIPVAFWEILCYCDCRINCCLRHQSLPLGEGGFFDLPLMRANRKRRMRAFLALNLLTFLYNRLEEVPHQSPQSVPKSRLWRQLPPGEAFGRYRASACKQQFTTSTF